MFFVIGNFSFLIIISDLVISYLSNILFQWFCKSIIFRYNTGLLDTKSLEYGLNDNNYLNIRRLLYFLLSYY